MPSQRSRRRFPPEILTDAEVRALLDAVRGTPRTRARNRALLAVLYRAGLRLGEALALRPQDVDPAAGAVRVLFAKGGRFRTAGIDAGAIALLDAWHAQRGRQRPPGDAPLFCTRSGRALTPAYVRRLLPELARRAGVAKRVHAHGLRHTHAAQLRAEGLDVGIISKQLGHASLFTTVIYLDHIAPTAVVEAVRARAWSHRDDAPRCRPRRPERAPAPSPRGPPRSDRAAAWPAQ